MPVIKKFLTKQSKLVCLVKPQFEAGRENIGKKGVVKDKKIHIKVCKDIYSFANSQGYGVAAITFSPIKGPQGNIEYLFHLKNNENSQIKEEVVDEIISKSHEDLA